MGHERLSNAKGNRGDSLQSARFEPKAEVYRAFSRSVSTCIKLRSRPSVNLRTGCHSDNARHLLPYGQPAHTGVRAA